jgi:exopolyphosphatase/pppGpp-phosphohydrolase
MPRLLFVLLLCFAPLPVRAAAPLQHGGIEIGGSGVKVTVLEVREGSPWKRVYGKSYKTTLSVLEKDSFRQDAIDETVKHIGEAHDLLRDKYKIPPERIHLVGSSGVPKANNRDELVAALKKRTSKEIRFIDERTEVELGIRGIIPPDLQGSALSLDIGSGNTKGGYFDGDMLFFAAIPLGTVTFSESIKAGMKEKDESFATVAERLRETKLIAPLSKGAKAMPELAKRKKLYLSGGMVWAMVTLVRPEATDDAYVTLTLDDVKAFRKKVNSAKKGEIEIDVSKISEEGAKLRAKAEATTVNKVYSRENLQAGVELLDALSEAFSLREKEIIFPRNAAYGWLGAYVAGAEKDKR